MASESPEPTRQSPLRSSPRPDSSSSLSKSPSLLRKAARTSTAAAISVSDSPLPSTSHETRGASSPKDDSDNASLSSLKDVLRDQLDKERTRKKRRLSDSSPPIEPEGRQKVKSSDGSILSDTKHDPEADSPTRSAPMRTPFTLYERTRTPPIAPSGAEGIVSPRPVSSRFDMDDISSEHISTPLNEYDPDEDQRPRLTMVGFILALAFFPISLPIRVLTCLPLARRLVPDALTPVSVGELTNTLFMLLMQPVLYIVRIVLGYGLVKSGRFDD